jgi:threonine dehydratase
MTRNAPAKPLAEVVRPTTIIQPIRLSRRLGVDLMLAGETFQHTGSFKFRAAYHLAANVTQERIITASSGNFGQALACACQMLAKECVVVMPDTSAQVKIEAVREFGGRVELINVAVKSRQQRVNELSAADPGAYVASAYDDPWVIEGNSSLGRELAARLERFDRVLTPVGGGGLASGLVQGLKDAGRGVPVFGVEPFLANDAARSFRAGQLVANEAEPQTMADGVRTISLGKRNWSILQHGLADVIEVSEEQIAEATRSLFLYANLKAEPTGALAVAALLARPEFFRGRSVCCVVSGGNVDPRAFCQLVGETRSAD